MSEQTTTARLLVQVCPCYVDVEAETGGVANVVRQISLGAAARGRRVVIVCGNRELGAVKAEPGRSRVPGHDLERIILGQRANPLLGPTGQLREVLQGLPQPYVAHVHTCFSAFTRAAMATFAGKGAPFVFTPHGKLSAGFLRRRRVQKALWWFLAEKGPARHAARVVLCSEGEAGGLPGLGLDGGFDVVPNGYSPWRGALPAGDGSLQGPYVLFLGYLDPRKQPELLVRAFGLSRARQSHRLVIAGPDSYGHRAKIEREVRHTGLDCRVILYGPAYGAEKQRLLSGARCFCLPSRAEGQPITLSEALGAGVPLVISAECNFGAAAAAGAAVELDTFDEGDWAAALDAVCLDGPRRSAMAAAAHRFAEGLTWDRIVERWLEIYDAVSGP